jgi:hypothetical protein
MSTNKITTKSYFIKRLRDGGYTVDKIDINFSESDSRRWMVLVDNGVSSLFVTCHNAGTFSFYDGSRFLAENIKLSTDSIEVVVEYLNKRGIINKHYNYAT